MISLTWLAGPRLQSLLGPAMERTKFMQLRLTLRLSWNLSSSATGMAIQAGWVSSLGRKSFSSLQHAILEPSAEMLKVLLLRSCNIVCN